MIKLRIGLLDDENFIKATMLKGLYYGCDFYGNIEQESFFKHYSPIVAQLIRDKDVIVACLADEPDVILGYAIVSGAVLHYVFVKEAWRKQGIAKRMLDGLQINCVTHLTNVGNCIRMKHKWLFDPWKL